MEVNSLYEVYRLSEGIVRKNAYAELRTKGHNVYFIDLGRYFGLSMCVFYDGAHCYTANKYQLDWHFGSRPDKDKFLEVCIREINNIIFTDDELSEVHSHTDYCRKNNYLINIYPKRKTHIMFYEFKEKIHFGDAKDFIYDDYAFAYYDKTDADFVKHHIELCYNLYKIEREAEEGYDYIRDAFLSVMCMYNNNDMLDYHTLSAFGVIRNDKHSGDRLNNYFDSLGFTEMKRSAYLSAKDEYRKIYN